MRTLNFSIAVLAAVSGIIATTFAASSGTPAYACYTPAKGCIEQGGPGQSFLARPEVAGCHFFAHPASDCTQMSTPPGMGAGPK